MRIFMVVAVLALTVGCAGTRQPAWTSGKNPDYPAESWLVGVGVDRDRGRAEDRARTEIAKIFQVEIRAVDRSEESHRLSQIGKMANAEYSQAVSAEMTAKTDKMLAGVRIVEVWQNPKTGEYHVLAGLDRLRVARGLRSELQGLDNRLAEMVGRAEGSLSPPRRLGLYLQALRLAEDRRRLAADLRIIEPSGWVAEAPYSAHEIGSRADRAAAAIRVGLQLAEKQPAVVQGALVRALADVGIVQAPAGEQNLVVRGTITLENYTTASPLLWSMASAQVEILDGDGTVLDALRSSVREGSQVSGRAETLAREKLGEKLAAQMIERLGYLVEKR